jgi:hypothetical protein
LLPDADRGPDTDVLNGIAWDADTNRLFVTGKRWPDLFQIAVVDPGAMASPLRRAQWGHIAPFAAAPHSDTKSSA